MNRILAAIGTPSALPIAPAQYQQGDPDTRVIVLPSQSGSKQNVLDLLNRVAGGNPNRFAYLRAIFKDARSSSIDNWTG